MTTPPAVEMRGITKRFRGVAANSSLDLTVQPGTVHAIVGENGAGKSTLMKILYGMLRPDEGTIRINGTQAEIDTPSIALDLGIAMVHQHFMLLPTFPVAENIVLGKEPPGRLGTFPRSRALREVHELLSSASVSLDPDAPVGSLPVGLQQQVEILKVLYRKARIIILDEPTAVLTPQEVTSLLGTISHLRSQGVTIILITHKLQEVLAVSDAVTVLRNGLNVLDTATASVDAATLANAMVGRDIPRVENPRTRQPLEPVLEFRDVSVLDEQTHRRLDSVTFSLRRGEILGVAGVEGSGQQLLVELVCGLRSPGSGSIRRLSERIGQFPAAYIPADRHTLGLILPFSAEENYLLGRQREEMFTGVFGFAKGRVSEFARRMMGQFNVTPVNPDLPARSFSGGNQQKIVLGRELTRNCDVIVAHQPSRGLDIGAIESVHRHLLDQRNEGRGILLVSSDLGELLSLSDRIAVMFNGSMTAIFDAASCSEEQLGLAMAGIDALNDPNS